MALGALPAQSPTWRPVGSPLSWQPGIGAMVYDDLHDRTVFFGGGQGYQPFAVLMELDGETWSTATVGSPWPTPRFWPALAYDSRRGEVVLHGGHAVGPAWFTDTWRWNGSGWSRATPAHVPPAMLGHGMAYDEARDRIVLFGTETWEWDGADWLQQAPAQSPPARSYLALAFDARRARTVLFGGTAGVSNLSDTWEWDGNSWLQTATSGLQPTAIMPTMAFDRERGRMLLVGSLSGSGTAAYEFDGVTWAQVAMPSGVPMYSRLAYDRQRGRAILFAPQGLGPGSPATWAYATDGRAVAQPYGVACGSPELRIREDGTARPVIGGELGVDVLGVPAGIAFMCFGWSNRQVLGLTLPMPMTIFGLPECWLLQSDDAITLPCVPTGASTARFSLAIPNDASFVGARFFVQPWAPAPGMFPPVDAVVGNGLAATIGSF